MNSVSPIYPITSDAGIVVDDSLPVRGQAIEPRRAATIDAVQAALPLDDRGCAIIDLADPQYSPAQVEAWLTAGFDMPVLGLVKSGDVASAVRLMKAGALDVLEKPVDSQQLAEKIRELLSIGAAVHSQERTRQEIRRRIESLTPGERAVMEEVVAGKPNKSIASKLGFSLRTIELWRRNVMTKLEVESVAELVKLRLQLETMRGPHIRWNGCQCAANAQS